MAKDYIEELKDSTGAWDKETDYVDLTPAQEHTLENMERVEVRTALIAPYIVATFKTFQGQLLKLTIDTNGVIIQADIQE